MNEREVHRSYFLLGEPTRPVRDSFPTITVERGGIEYVRPSYPLVPIPRQVVLFPRWDAAMLRLRHLARRTRTWLAWRLYDAAVRLDDDLACPEDEWC